MEGKGLIITPLDIPRIIHLSWSFIRKCQKDHTCSFCHRTIIKGSSYLVAKDLTPYPGCNRKACLICFGSA